MPYERAAGGYMAARKASKKVINFFVVGLTYGWRKSWNRILRKPFSFSNCGKPVVTESGWIRLPIASTNTYRIGAKQSTLSILCSTVLTANLKVSKQVGFGDAIRAPDFHRRDFAFVQQLVPRFGADSQGIAHLLDVGEKSAIFSQKKYRPLSCLLHLCKLHKTTTCFFCKM